jgi:Ni/Co efflux regulator RcnB
MVLATTAAILFAPLAAAAQDRGEERWRAAERRADYYYWRAQVQENRRPAALPPAARVPRGPAERARPQIWGRGDSLPPAARANRINDVERYRLRPPPEGYDWVVVGPDIYLIQRSSGLVLEAIPGGN